MWLTSMCGDCDSGGRAGFFHWSYGRQFSPRLHQASVSEQDAEGPELTDGRARTSCGGSLGVNEQQKHCKSTLAERDM